MQLEHQYWNLTETAVAHALESKFYARRDEDIMNSVPIEETSM